jgi:hypothetical protein
MAHRVVPPTRKELIEWVASILERECDAGTYGTITIHLESGRIVRAKTERSEMPETKKIAASVFTQ